MDLSSLSKEQLIHLAGEYFQNWQNAEHNAQLYLSQLNRLNNEKYGKKSEKITVLHPTLELFDEADELAAIDTHEEELIEVKKHRKRKPKVNAIDHLPKDIETEIIEHSVEDTLCQACGAGMHLLKIIERKEIVVIPRVLKLRIHKIPVYGCRSCEADDTCTIVKAEGPKLLFEKSPVSIEMVSYLMGMKYHLGIPLNRIESTMKVEGLLFPRHTYARWMIDTAAMYLTPIYKYMRELLMQEEVILADETHYKIYGEKGKKSIGKTYIWIYRNNTCTKHPIMLYQCAGGRRGEIPKSFLSEFTGNLVTNDYAGYNKVENVTRNLCHAHARRKYADIAKGKGKQEASDAPEVKVLQKYKDIFQEESKVIESCGEDYDHIRELRNTRMVEVEGTWKNISVRSQLDKLYVYLEELEAKTMKNSELYKAIQYSLSNKEWLYNFLKDGKVPMTNNLAEISIKTVIAVRKNTVFFGSPKGASASAIILSLIQTAKANGLAPIKYLQKVLTTMLLHTNEVGEVEIPAEKLEELLPWNME